MDSNLLFKIGLKIGFISAVMIIAGSFLLAYNLAWLSVLGLGVVGIAIAVYLFIDNIDWIHPETLFKRKKKEE